MSENVFLMSLSGSAVFLLWGLLSRLAGGRLGARWQYAAMQLVLLFLLIPVGPCLQWLGALWPAEEVSAGAVATFPDGELTAAVVGTVPSVLPNAPQVVISAAVHQAVLLLWGICAAGILTYKCGRFLRFRYLLKKTAWRDRRKRWGQCFTPVSGSWGCPDRCAFGSAPLRLCPLLLVLCIR